MKELERLVTEAKAKPMSRRALLQKASVAAVTGMIGNASCANGREAGGGELPMRAATAGAEKDRTFPDKFLWGCATAGHQVEGNKTNGDLWAMEHMPESIFKEPSGDACDHYHLYSQDIAMLADLGFNTYRFSLEWARIEPEEGFFSNAELEHYRRVLMTCRQHHLTTLVTYSHFSMPRWFACKGGWQNPFCEKATNHLGDLVDYASTFNEPDVPQLLNWINLPGTGDKSIVEMMQGNLPKARKYLNAPEFRQFLCGRWEEDAGWVAGGASQG